VKRLNILIFTFLTALSLSAQVGKELYRPVFHYTPGYNWMSDPNGLVYYNGKYHMFYQYNPYGTQPANQSWGHAISKDLVNWEERPVAIPIRNGLMVYSGCVVVDWKNTSGFGTNGKPPLVAIYTGASTVQDQRIAYSNDEGNTWTNYSGNPVLTMNNNQFRDPKVTWNENMQKWIMVVSQGSYQGIRIYSSPNLRNWTIVNGFAPTGNLSGMWECPDLFKMQIDSDSTKEKWVLAHSVTPNAQYFIGKLDSSQFTWEKVLPNGILIDDFEGDNYNNWTVTGTSFGSSPIKGTASSSGYLGNKLINSFSDGNAAQGKLVSHDFTISKRFISFLIGGGYYPTGTYIKLIVNGETIRSGTGMNEDLMKWRNWDVSSFIGRKGRIEIVDSVTGVWGHINIDHLIQSDAEVDNVNYGQVDYGKDFYALQTFSDIPNGRKIWIAWMNNWSYATATPTTPWKGIMSIPREITLQTRNGQLKLIQNPIEELTTLRKSNISFRNKNVSEINSALNNNMINNIQSNTSFKQFELKAKIAVQNKSGFSLKFKKYGVQYSEFVFDFVNKEIRFDRSRSGALTADQYYRQLQIAPLIVQDGFIDLHLFVDNSSVELFSGGGEVVMSNLIFPDSVSNRIEFTSLDEDFSIEEFDIWKFQKSFVLPGQPIENFPLFKLYPNPVVNSNGVTIKIKEQMVGEVKFKLFDDTGTLIYEFLPSSNSMILPRNKMATSKGILFLKGSYGSFTQTEKIVVAGD
jgi:sucrose-6-phosphate hydrolase SacC (GH32 family)